MTSIRRLGSQTSSPASPSCHKADSPSSYPGTGKQSAKILEPFEPRHSLDDYDGRVNPGHDDRSEEHTSELQSLMRISYAVFCLKKKNIINSKHTSYRYKYH